MATCLCGPPAQDLAGCLQMVFDDIATMLLVEVKAHIGAKQVGEQELLQGGLLYAHVLVAKAQVQHDVAEHILPRHLLNATSRPVKLVISCCLLLELTQLQAEHHTLGKVRLEHGKPIPFPSRHGHDGARGQGGGQGQSNLQRAGVD